MIHSSKTIRIKVIVPIADDSFNERILASIQEVVAPDVEVDIENISEGTTCIEGREAIAINTPGVLALAKKAQRDGFHGIFVTDMDFCGVEAVREVVDIPIIGGFRPNAFTAMAIASRFSIITIQQSVVAMQREHIRSFGIEPNFASIRLVKMSVDDLKDVDKVREAVFVQALKAIDEDGAEAIILGCTGFIDVAAYVTGRLQESKRPAPVLDPNHLGVTFLTMLIRNGLSQSRMTYVHQAGLP